MGGSTQSRDEAVMITAQQSKEDMLAGIAMNCAYAVIAGQPTVTISVVNGKRPAGFPRGELLSLGTNGASNYAVNPVKVLAWIHAKTSSATPKGGA